VNRTVDGDVTRDLMVSDQITAGGTSKAQEPLPPEATDNHVVGDIPMELDLKLSVEDSPNSAGIVIDAIRCCKLALDRGIGGALHSPSAYFAKRPPVQMTDDEAHRCVEQFIRGERES